MTGYDGTLVQNIQMACSNSICYDLFLLAAHATQELRNSQTHKQTNKQTNKETNSHLAKYGFSQQLLEES